MPEGRNRLSVAPTPNQQRLSTPETGSLDFWHRHESWPLLVDEYGAFAAVLPVNQITQFRFAGT